MEHKPMKSFGSLVGNNSDLILAFKENNDSKSSNRETEIITFGSRTMKHWRSNLTNDFEILSSNDKPGSETSSVSRTSNNINSSSVK